MTNRRRIETRGIAAVALLAAAILQAPARASAQGAVNDPPTVWFLNGAHFTTDPLVDLTGVAAFAPDDYVNRATFCYRIAGDPREYYFPVPNTQDYTSPVVTLDWTNVNGRGFNARRVDVVTTDSAAPPGGQVQMTLTIFNPGPGSLQIDVFHIYDLNLIPFPTDDVGTLVTANNHIRFADSGSSVGDYKAFGPTSYIALPQGAGDVGGIMADADTDNFNNTGLPAAASNITTGFQWPTATIPPSGQASFSVVFSVNMPLPVASPTPSPSASPTRSPSPSPSPTRSPSPTPSPSASPSRSPSPSASPTRSPSPSASPSRSPSPSPSPSASPSRSPSPSPSPSASPTRSPSPTPSASPSPSATGSPAPTNSPSPSPTASASPSPSPSPSPTASRSPSPTSTGSPSPSPSPTTTPAGPTPSPSPTGNAARDWSIYE